MPKPTAVQPYSYGPTERTATTTALVALGGEIEAQLAYQRILSEDVFTTIEIDDRKSRARYQRTLSAQSTIGILTIIWKESIHVSDDDLVVAGIGRLFSEGEPLNCHSLATRLADEPKDLGRMLKRIETIVAAAAAYGLVERAPLTNIRWKELRATKRLDMLMLRMGASLRAVYAGVVDRNEGLSNA